MRVGGWYHLKRRPSSVRQAMAGARATALTRLLRSPRSRLRGRISSRLESLARENDNRPTMPSNTIVAAAPCCRDGRRIMREERRGSAMSGGEKHRQSEDKRRGINHRNGRRRSIIADINARHGENQSLRESALHLGSISRLSSASSRLRAR